MASLYNNKTLKQLKSIALERDIDFQGLRKAEIIDELIAYDEDNGEDDEVVVVTKTISPSVSKGLVEADPGSTSIPSATGDSEQQQMLKLQLQIAEANRVTEETKLKQIQLGTSSVHSVNVGQANVTSEEKMISQLKNRLPVMPQDGDIMN